MWTILSIVSRLMEIIPHFDLSPLFGLPASFWTFNLLQQFNAFLMLTL